MCVCKNVAIKKSEYVSQEDFENINSFFIKFYKKKGIENVKITRSRNLKFT